MASSFEEIYMHYENLVKKEQYIAYREQRNENTKEAWKESKHKGMRVTSEGITDGIITDRFGKRGEDLDKHGIPTRSLPITIEDAPEGTKTFALILEDKDAVPVCGFSWIHWLAANIKKSRLEENESITATDYIQGTTSWHGVIGASMGIDRMEVSRYGGMTPPNEPHIYEMHVYALDTELDLEQGFYMNELYHAIQGHILAEATMCGIYKN